MTAPLVFLPGWCLGRSPLIGAVDALNGQIFDLPGYGESRGGPAKPEMADLADMVAELIRAIGFPRVHLHGTSFGAP